MYRTYHSIGGVVNIVFTAVMFLLTFRFWAGANLLVKILLPIGCTLFIIWQPLGVMLNAMATAERFPKNVWLEADEDGIHVSMDHKKQSISWRKIFRVSKEPNMVVIYTDKAHGYMLTKRTIGNQMEEFCSFITDNIERVKKK